MTGTGWHVVENASQSDGRVSRVPYPSGHPFRERTAYTGGSESMFGRSGGQA